MPLERDAIAALCRAHGVSRLQLFGSAATGGFDADRSDYDFIVDFTPAATPGRSRPGVVFGLRAAFHGHEFAIRQPESPRGAGPF